MSNMLKLFLQISVFASLMILVVIALRAVFAKRMNPLVIGVLWAVVLLRLCLPVMVESPIRLIAVFPEEPSTVQEVYSTEDSRGSAEETALSSIDTSAVQISMEEPETFETLSEVQTADAETEATQEATLWQRLVAWVNDVSFWDAFTVLWLAGAVAVIARTVWRGAAFKRGITSCKRANDERVAHVMKELKGELRINKRIDVRECSHVAAPAVFGFLKPVLLLPEAFAQNADSETIRCVFLHELCHIKSADILKGYMWLVAKALHWFNPFVWVAHKMSKDDIEFCCDQMVMRRLSEMERFAYTQTLIDVFRMSRQSAPIPATVSLSHNRAKLTERVMRMLKPNKKSKTALAVTIVMILIMGISCFTTACIQEAKAGDDSQDAQVQAEQNEQNEQIEKAETKQTPEPTAEPTSEPTAAPTTEPTAAPTSEPMPEPTAAPTSEPMPEPAAAPTSEPMPEPTAALTSEPMPQPAAAPTSEQVANTVNEFMVEADIYYDEVGYSSNTYEYTDDEKYMLAQLIHSEAKDESWESKIAIGNVVMNRVLADGFPGTTISDVISAHGQFSIYSSSVEPSELCLEAARYILEYELWVIPQNVYYYNSTMTEGQNWGMHEFYERIGKYNYYTEQYEGRSNIAAVPPSLFERTYKWPRYGCKPEPRVRSLQTILSVLGYDISSIDSYFGSDTLEAVKQFQKDNDISVDGIAGSATIEALINAYGAAQ